MANGIGNKPMKFGKLNQAAAIVSLTSGVDTEMASRAKPMTGIARLPQTSALSNSSPSVFRSSQPAPSTM